MTLFGMQQFRNGVEGVVDATRWTFFTAFTCPDCGIQQDVASDFRKTMNAMTDSVASQLDAGNKAAFDRLAEAGSEMVSRAFEAAEVIYPFRDDRIPDPERPAFIRGYQKRAQIPVLDPRRWVEIGEKQIEVTAAELSRAAAAR